ncbi:MAG: glycosyltransferase family 4 protein [Geoalkalibacter sp.]|uniref:glycosyltransferase family 4 protein n=1 Tax=Geoalkalibacter sp. TaxID=3041440 RepID=UPI003D10402C
MKVLMLNTFDEVGGAARAAVRLQEGLREAGVDSSLLVYLKSGNAGNVICKTGPHGKTVRQLKTLLGTLPVRIYPGRPVNNFSPALLPDHIASEVAQFAPDIVHLHWLGAGFVQVETLRRLGKPIVWTFHDSWAFTGGCHVPFDCKRYQQRCGSCPVLGSKRERDLSRWTWNRKKRAWETLNPTVVTPSRWLADCVQSSSLFGDGGVEVIPNGLDTEVFRPMHKEQARSFLGLPQDKKIILFGAVRGFSDPNKGFHLLVQALQCLNRSSSDLLALIFNAFDRADRPDMGIPAVVLGQIVDDRKLAAVYSAADVFVAPSIQETFCQTAVEAMACGTPVVAFGSTGLLDVVEHHVSGYLAQPYEIEDLARGIAWVIEDDDRHRELSRRARLKVQTDYSLAVVSQLYLELYKSIMSRQ